MAAFEKARPELDALGIKVVAASVDPRDKAQEVAAELSYPVAFGVTRAMADRLGSWWEDRRGIVQPSEFIVDGPAYQPQQALRAPLGYHGGGKDSHPGGAHGLQIR